jgi:hypothetical protein
MFVFGNPEFCVCLEQSRVDDVEDAVDGERGLGDVCRDDNLPPSLGRRAKDLALGLEGQRGVYGEDDVLAFAAAHRHLREDRDGLVDLVLAGEKEQDVAVAVVGLEIMLSG